MSIEIIPAIDLLDGQCVRLTRGDYATSKVYGGDPLEVARRFERMGAEWLHVVDLNGARGDGMMNLRTVERICAGTRLRVEFGGGVRRTEDAEAAFGLLRAEFETLAEQRDQAQQTASDALEAAFDFMEQAFAESQEMVVFVTELTLSPGAHAFIAENGCERYFRYNKDLLLDSRKAALQRELAAEEGRNGGL